MNYYLHSIFLVVMLGADKRVLPWLTLLAMCLGCYWTTLVSRPEDHFDREASVVLAMTAVLVVWRLMKSFAVEMPAASVIPK